MRTSRRRRTAWLAFAATLGIAGLASAHGPTLRVAYSGVRPTVLRIEAGTTVHFHNANGSDGSCTLIGEGGAFESPTLARGEGWHHTFETPGTYRFVVREYPEAAGTVIVGPAGE